MLKIISNKYYNQFTTINLIVLAMYEVFLDFNNTKYKSSTVNPSQAKLTSYNQFTSLLHEVKRYIDNEALP